MTKVRSLLFLYMLCLGVLSLATSGCKSDSSAEGDGASSHDSGVGRENEPRKRCTQARTFAAGIFTDVDNVNRGRIVGLEGDGRTSYFNEGRAGFNFEEVYKLEPELDAEGLPTGSIFAVGHFNKYNGEPVSAGIVKLDSCGAINHSFNRDKAGFTGTNGLRTGDGGSALFDIKSEYDNLGRPTGKLLVGGIFTHYNGEDVPDYLIRIDGETGDWDPTFNLGGQGFNERVMVIVPERDTSNTYTGKFFVGGGFRYLNGQTAPCFVRLNSDGSNDPTFVSAWFGNGVSTATLEMSGQLPTGNVIVGGYFYKHIKRLTHTGAEDLTYAIGAGLQQEPMAFLNEIDADDGTYTGKLIVGGNFLKFNDVPISNHLIRLNANGTLDSSFNQAGSGFDSQVWTLAHEQTPAGAFTGKLLVGGSFLKYNGEQVRTVIRLLSTGARDSDFVADSSLQIGLIRDILSVFWRQP